MIKVVYTGAVRCQDVVSKLLTEDKLFTDVERANMSIRAFGGQIDKIVEEGDTRTIYIKEIDNLLLG